MITHTRRFNKLDKVRQNEIISEWMTMYPWVTKYSIIEALKTMNLPVWFEDGKWQSHEVHKTQFEQLIEN